MSSTPGDIEWLARIDKVEIDLTGQNPFGLVTSGLLQLTGRLGVLNLQSKDKENHRQDDGLSQQITGIYLHWDTTETASQYRSQEDLVVRKHITFRADPYTIDENNAVLCMPLRIMGYDFINHDYEAPFLQGLLLRRVENTVGYYRRIGLFSISDQVSLHRDSVSKARDETDIRDTASYVSRTENGQYTIVIV